MNFSPSNITNSMGNVPADGPKAVPQRLDWSVQPSYDFDITLLQQQGRMSSVQCAWVDNSTNDQPVVLFTSNIQQTISIAPGWQGYTPILVTDNLKLTISSSGGGITSCIFLNFPIAAAFWPGILPPAGDPSTVQKVADAPASPVNRSGSIVAGGVAQIAAPPNPARRAYSVQNLDAVEILWFNDTGGPAMAGAGSFVLYPGGAAEGISSAPISVFAATTGHLFTLTEY